MFVLLEVFVDFRALLITCSYYHRNLFNIFQQIAKYSTKVLFFIFCFIFFLCKNPTANTFDDTIIVLFTKVASTYKIVFHISSAYVFFYTIVLLRLRTYFSTTRLRFSSVREEIDVTKGFQQAEIATTRMHNVYEFRIVPVDSIFWTAIFVKRFCRIQR